MTTHNRSRDPRSKTRAPIEVERRLMAAYRGVLRRASKIGWPDALNEYAREEKAHGRPGSDVAADVDVFTQIDLAERLKGIDPILAEKRRELHLGIAMPIAMVAGVIVTGMVADKGFDALTSVVAGTLAALAGYQIGTVLTFLLVRR